MKAAGVKKIRLRATYNFSGLSEQEVLRKTDNEAKYQKFNAKFLNKAAPRPARAENIFSQLQIDLAGIRNQLTEDKNKVYQYIFSLMNVLNRFHGLIHLERKFPRHVKPHLEKLFIEDGPSKGLQSNRGKEYKIEVK